MDELPFAKRRSLSVRAIGGNSREAGVEFALGFEECPTGDPIPLIIAIGVNVVSREGERVLIGYCIDFAASWKASEVSLEYAVKELAPSKDVIGSLLVSFKPLDVAKG